MKPHEQDRPDREPSRMKWVLIGFLVVAGYFLVTEHRAHVIEYLPVLLLAACVGMHFFHGHGGHGRHGGQGDNGAPGEARPDERAGPRHRH